MKASSVAPMVGTLSAESAPLPRSLADQLRGWPDERVAHLLSLRPDLATPTPGDSSQLASRAATRPSVLRALDSLSRRDLWLLHALIRGGETPRDQVAGVAADLAGPAEPADLEGLAGSLNRLEDLALVWEGAGGLRPLTMVADLLGPDTANAVWEPRPALLTSQPGEAAVQQAGAAAAFDAVRRTELILETWSNQPPGVLRSGGLGVRDLRAAATALHVDEADAGFLIEVAGLGGLLGEATPRDTAVWLPTDAFDLWLRRSPAHRWATLALAWWRSPRIPAAVGGRDTSGKTLNALAPGLVDVHATQARGLALRALAALPEGEGLATGTGLASLVAQLQWDRPRQPRSWGTLIAWAIEDATRLGLVARGALTPAGRAIADGATTEQLAATIEPDLPAPLDHILIQGDLTAVAPGPVESEIARDLQLLADVESHGHATTYRFSSGSVRRALDAGWSAAEVRDFLNRVSRTPLPQALDYLVDDTARTYGSLRMGYAEAFLRSDDEAALQALAHDRRTASLGLRVIAPTVAISTTPIDVLLTRLRDLGFAPVVEAEDGTVHVPRAESRRARTPWSRPASGVDGGPAASARGTAHVAAAVTAVRAGDRIAATRPTTTRTTTPGEALTALGEAIEARQEVLIRFVDNHGAASERLVLPRRLDGGRLTAYDARTDVDATFPVHRITSVSPATNL